MSNTIKFTNGAEYSTITVQAKETYVQGASRKTLEIQFAKDAVDFAALETLTADSANIDTLTIKDDTGEYIHNHYSIRTEIAIKPVVVMPTTADAPEETEERICLTLAQLTYVEIQNAQYAKQIADLQEAVAAGVFGGEQA